MAGTFSVGPAPGGSSVTGAPPAPDGGGGLSLTS
jgi:hypothetical protein